MSKFKINEKVISVESGKVGVVRLRNVIHHEKKTVVEYMVDFGGTMADWKIMAKNQLKRVSCGFEERTDVIREYCYGDNQMLLMVARVENTRYLADNPKSTDWFDEIIEKKGRKLSIGFSIYNGSDEYDQSIGIKYARHRLKKAPFCTMESRFNGEFNQTTTEAIMDAKAEYIKNHWNEFYRPRN